MASEHPEREDPSFYHWWMDENVRFHDLDAYNHVNNNVIGIYFETARMAWLEDMQPKGWLTAAHFVLGKNTIWFLRELNYPNKVRLGQRVLRVGDKSMTSAGAIFCNNTCVAQSETVSIWINSKTRKSESISDNIRHTLQRYT